MYRCSLLIDYLYCVVVACNDESATMAPHVGKLNERERDTSKNNSINCICRGIFEPLRFLEYAMEKQDSQMIWTSSTYVGKKQNHFV